MNGKIVFIFVLFATFGCSLGEPPVFPAYGVPSVTFQPPSVNYGPPPVVDYSGQQTLQTPYPYGTSTVPVLKAVPVVEEPYDPQPQYQYGYSVYDSITGDSKQASESRDGDFVKGEYSLVEPDGVTIRKVVYTADSSGFNAVVTREAATVPATTPIVQAILPLAPALQYAPPNYGWTQYSPSYPHAKVTSYFNSPRTSYGIGIKPNFVKGPSVEAVGGYA